MNILINPIDHVYIVDSLQSFSASFQGTFCEKYDHIQFSLQLGLFRISICISHTVCYFSSLSLFLFQGTCPHSFSLQRSLTFYSFNVVNKKYYKIFQAPKILYFFTKLCKKLKGSLKKIMLRELLFVFFLNLNSIYEQNNHFFIYIGLNIYLIQDQQLIFNYQFGNDNIPKKLHQLNFVNILVMICNIFFIMYKAKCIPPNPPPLPGRKRNISTQKKPMAPVLLKNSSPKKEKNKSVEYTSKKRKVSLQIKTKFKISQSHMGFLIEEQKTSDLAVIRSSVSLNYYYEALMSLFSLIYSSSQIITSNIFEQKKQSTGLSGLKFVGILFSIYQFVWNEANRIKLKSMARNVMKMGSTPRLFEQKIQFICRKIVLNYNMQKRIQMAFLNTKLDSFWKMILNRFKLTDQVQILEEMYETAPQKLAYWDFSYFVNDYLAEEDFYQVLKDCNKSKKVQSQKQDTLSHNFTYQFMIIEIFCFHQEQAERQDTGQVKKDKNCQLI